MSFEYFVGFIFIKNHNTVIEYFVLDLGSNSLAQCNELDTPIIKLTDPAMTVIILCVVPKLCGAKSYQLFAPKPQAENLCPSALVPPMTLPRVLVSHPPQGDTGSKAVSGRRTTRVSPVTKPHCCHCLCTWPECPNLSPCEKLYSNEHKSIQYEENDSEFVIRVSK